MGERIWPGVTGISKLVFLQEARSVQIVCFLFLLSLLSPNDCLCLVTEAESNHLHTWLNQSVENYHLCLLTHLIPVFDINPLKSLQYLIRGILSAIRKLSAFHTLFSSFSSHLSITSPSLLCSYL